jgi:uncharacterized repeat protein (TIGR03803 family)
MLEKYSGRESSEIKEQNMFSIETRLKTVPHALQAMLIANASVLVLCAATVIPLPAQIFTTLHSFDSKDGAIPYGAQVQALSGGFYGTTSEGGILFGVNGGHGTIFRIVPNGTLTTLYEFCNAGCWDGSEPLAGLVQATNGDFYGTTEYGGGPDFSLGTVFSITSGGTLTTLHSFSGYPTDGKAPNAVLVQASNGDFYGTTPLGGANGGGTVFTTTPSGTLTILHSFCAAGYSCTDGVSPQAGLVQAGNGDLYGTTEYGGTNSCVGSPSGGCGTIYKITPSGTLTTVHEFCSKSGCSDGSLPVAGLQMIVFRRLRFVDAQPEPTMRKSRAASALVKAASLEAYEATVNSGERS